MRKREEFAISLRKEKKTKIIQERRKRLMLSNKLPDGVKINMPYTDNKMYDCCPLFKEEVHEDHPDKDKLTSLEETIQRVLPDLPQDIESNGENKNEVNERKVQQIEMLLARLFNNDDPNVVAPIDQLAIFVTLRRVLGNARKIPVLEIYRRTQIVYLLKSLLNWINSNPLQNCREIAEIQYYFEQELGWILVNLANGPNEVVYGIFYDRYDEPNQNNEPSPVVL